MSYAAVTGRRMPYDIDGTEVGWRNGMDANSLETNGVYSWLDSASKGNLNKGDRSQAWGTGWNSSQAFWFFFPETREITHLATQQGADAIGPVTLRIAGSNDTTNGVDGTWESAVFNYPGRDTGIDLWRKSVFAVSFSGPIKVLRVVCVQDNWYDDSIHGIHIYGMKASGQTPDDVIFCSSDGTEYTSLKDWGDSPEGTTAYSVFYLKNTSSKTANGVNLQLNHADFAISTDQATWQAVIDIANLSPGAISQPIYTRRLLQPPLLTLGPKAARAILTIASFT